MFEVMQSLSATGPDAGKGLLLGAPVWLVASYLLLLWHGRLEGSASRDDGQVGLKVVVFFLLLVGLGIAANGVAGLLHYLLSGAKAGKDTLKASIAGVIAGAAPVFAVLVLLLPRTNSAQYPKAARFCAGFIAASAGFSALLAFNALLHGLIAGSEWILTSLSFANLLVFGGLTIVAIARLGALSGWVSVMRPTQSGGAAGASPAAYPPQQGYGPPGAYGQGGGYNPQGGGYPPQGGGGYPPR
jgi:hypothetical protein